MADIREHLKHDTTTIEIGLVTSSSLAGVPDLNLSTTLLATNIKSFLYKLKVQVTQFVLAPRGTIAERI